MLLILDDVRDGKLLQYFDFPCVKLITTRESTLSFQTNNYRINLSTEVENRLPHSIKIVPVHYSFMILILFILILLSYDTVFRIQSILNRMVILATRGRKHLKLGLRILQNLRQLLSPMLLKNLNVVQWH